MGLLLFFSKLDEFVAANTISLERQTELSCVLE